MRLARRYFVVGGAGFIGSHLADRLLAGTEVEYIAVYDNFTSGRDWHLAAHGGDPRLCIVRADVKDVDTLISAMRGHDVAIHLASNPDIARAATEPAIDFHEGTHLTHNVMEAMHASGTTKILYASGSGVYGDLGHVEAEEDHGPLRPISTYGASKVAGEALISAYCHMFSMVGCAFRFGNVVGPRQTHGVGFDFIRQLLRSPSCRRILGDGTQSKSYIHIVDIIDAVLLASNAATEGFRVYNVATGDYITVAEVADLAVGCIGLPSGTTEYVFAGGDRGWKGDVPIRSAEYGSHPSVGMESHDVVS